MSYLHLKSFNGKIHIHTSFTYMTLLQTLELHSVVFCVQHSHITSEDR